MRQVADENKRRRKPFEMEKRWAGTTTTGSSLSSLYKMAPEWLDKYTFREPEREREKGLAYFATDLMVQEQQSEAAVVQKLIDPIAASPRAYSLFFCSSFSSSLTLMLPQLLPMPCARLRPVLRASVSLFLPHHFHLIPLSLFLSLSCCFSTRFVYFFFPSCYLHLSSISGSPCLFCFCFLFLPLSYSLYRCCIYIYILVGTPVDPSLTPGRRGEEREKKN